MIGPVVRSIKRFLILVPGLLIGYFAYVDLLPALERHLPSELALVVTYILAAYLLIPIGLRVFRLFVKPSHLPLYSTTPDGLASDPLNIGLVGTRQEVIAAMERAGWHRAVERTPRTLAQLVICVVLRRPFPNAPFSPLYLFGRKQDLGFQLPVGDDPSNRHHVRFWAASHTSDPSHLHHITFWERFHKADMSKQRILWVGAASLDNGLGIIRHTAQLTHMIHPDTNAERELIVKHLKKTSAVKKIRSQVIGRPYRLPNRVLNGYFNADGKITICEL